MRLGLPTASRADANLTLPAYFLTTRDVSSRNGTVVTQARSFRCFSVSDAAL